MDINVQLLTASEYLLRLVHSQTVCQMNRQSQY
jgi:hypothetical protein